MKIRPFLLSPLILPAHKKELCTIHLTMPNKYTFPVNPVRICGIFGVCCEALPRQINYLIDKSVNMGKGANLLSVICMIFFKIMVRARTLAIFMQKTVVARKRTIMYSGTFAGGSFMDFMNMLPTLCSLQDTPNLAPIGVLGFWNRKFVEHLFHHCST